MINPETTAEAKVNRWATNILYGSVALIIISPIAIMGLSAFGAITQAILHNTLGWSEMEVMKTNWDLLWGAWLGLQRLGCIVGPPLLLYRFAILAARRIDRRKPHPTDDF